MKHDSNIETIYLYNVSGATVAAGNGVNNSTLECWWNYPVIIKRIIAGFKMNLSYGLPSVCTLIMSGGSPGAISYMTTGKGFDPQSVLVWSSTLWNMDIKLQKGIYVPEYVEETNEGIISFQTGMRSQNTIPIGEQLTTNIIIEGVRA